MRDVARDRFMTKCGRIQHFFRRQIRWLGKQRVNHGTKRPGAKQRMCHPKKGALRARNRDLSSHHWRFLPPSAQRSAEVAVKFPDRPTRVLQHRKRKAECYVRCNETAGQKSARRYRGGLVLAAGLALLVLPGPAFLVIPAGLAILASEFDWAKRLMQRFEARWEQWRKERSERKARKHPVEA
jgi:hypothetical protein